MAYGGWDGREPEMVIQDQQERIAALEKRVAELEARTTPEALAQTVLSTPLVTTVSDIAAITAAAYPENAAVAQLRADGERARQRLNQAIANVREQGWTPLGDGIPEIAGLDGIPFHIGYHRAQALASQARPDQTQCDCDACRHVRALKPAVVAGLPEQEPPEPAPKPQAETWRDRGPML